MQTPGIEQSAAAAVEALKRGQVLEAEALARKTLMAHPGEPRASEVLALICLNGRRFDEAVEVLRAALEEAPDNPVLLSRMGQTYAAMERFRPAAIYFQQAVQAAPDDAGTWESLGKATYRLRRFEHSRAAFEHCLELEPDNADARATLARIELQDRNFTGALELAAEVVATHPDHVMGRQALADANLWLGNYERAIEGALGITDLPNASSKVKVAAFGTAAQAAEAMGRYDDAFAYYTGMNQAVVQTYSRGYERAQERRAYEKLEGIISLGPQLAERSKDWKTNVEIPPTIYYIGFVNSGMSIFNAIMLRHPRLVSGKDRAQVRAWEELVWAEDAVDRVGAVNFEDVERLRRDFVQTFDDADIHLKPGQAMFDQRPFYTRHMTTLALALPDAKYILAHRDPRDVVLACFKHRSPPNVSMYEFLDIETAARYYDLSMTATVRAIEDYDLTIARLGYDQLWADPEAETRRILEFVGLPWDDALLAPDGTLLGDAKKSPSVWRHYESHLAPVMPILQKWVDYFGYE